MPKKSLKIPIMLPPALSYEVFCASVVSIGAGVSLTGKVINITMSSFRALLRAASRGVTILDYLHFLLTLEEPYI